MQIKLDKMYYLMSDSNQYILGKQTKDKIIYVGFFISLEHLLVEYVNRCVRTQEDITTIAQLVKYQKSLIAGLNQALTPLHIEVLQK